MSMYSPGKIPKCCGKQMEVRMETSVYSEVHCRQCGDTIYIKRGSTPKPQMLDD